MDTLPIQKVDAIGSVLPVGTQDEMSAGGGVIDWLFGMSKFGFMDKNTRFAFEHELAIWAWGLIVVIALLAAVWSYSRLIGPRWIRLALASIRTLLIVFLALLLAGPLRVKDNHQVIEDWLLVMVDQSASMRQKDVESKAGNTPTVAGSDAKQFIERHEAVSRLLRTQADVFSEDQLGKDRRIVWFGFDAHARRISPLYQATDGSTKPEGRKTLLHTAIQDVLKANVGRRVCGIVLITDGRSTESTGTGLARQLDRDSIKVFTVPVGAKSPKLDLSLLPAHAPSRAFINDAVSVRVAVDHQPSGVPVDWSRVKLRLVDQASGRVLDQKSLGGRPPGEPIQMSAVWTKAQTVTWKVELEYQAIDPENRDRNPQNNHQTVRIKFIDRPLRVLYIEGYPRWEYRYLKELLRQDKTIAASIMLVSADLSFAQEGDLPIARLPRNLEELASYDVLIIGDVPSEYLGTELMGVIRDHVSIRGAGVIWVGGAHYTPQTYGGTPLGDLLPMRQPGLVRKLELGGAAVTVSPKPAARSLNLLRIDDASKNPNPSSLTGLPGLYWVQDIGELKRSVEVLAEAHLNAQEQVPLLTLMRHGAGRILYLATDEIWRWRYGRGAGPTQEFWIPLVQYLGWARGRQNDQQAWMNISARRAEVDQTLVVTVQLRDGFDLQRDLDRLRIVVKRANDPAQSVVETFEVNSRQRDDLQLGQGRTYTAQWRPRHSGKFILQLDEPTLADVDVRQSVLVEHSDAETRYATVDHKRLEDLAKETGGKLVPLDNLGSLAGLLPPDPEQVTISISQTLWDCPLTLILFGLLLTLEWIGRKLIKLI
jgi:hypothetical protein